MGEVMVPPVVAESLADHDTSSSNDC